ncbi:MAG: hypothetical protein SFX18_19575 [Pirellulales bacterium]|nr:hypothetical protein [Pirellulales bacterium]
MNAKSRYSASVAADDELGSGGNSASDESAGSASDLSGDPFTRPAGQANTASRGSSSFDPGEGAAAASFPAASPTRSTTDIPNASTIDSPSGTGYAPLNQSDSGGTSSELTTNHPPRENAATPYADELGNSPAYNDPAAGASKAITPLDHGLNSANEASPNAYATDDATPANPRALPGSAQNPMRLREIPSPLAPDDASQGNAATTSTADVAPRPLTSTTTADDTLPTEVGALEQAQNPAVLNNTSGPETSAYHSADSATNSALRQTTLTNESPLSPLQPLATSENSISHQQSSDIEPPSQPIRIPDAARELPPRSNMTVATGFAPANSTGVAAASPYVPRAGTPAFAATAEDSSSGSVSGIPNFTGNASTAPLSPSNGSDTQLSEPGRLRFSTPTAGIPPADKVSPPPGLDTGVNPNERDPAFTAQQLGYQAEGAISNQATTGSTNSTIPRSYVVQAQDSYYAIAERMYGNGAFYKALYEHNRRLQPGGDRLQPGGTLEIPAVDYLKANYAELLPSSAVNPTADRQPLIFHR